MALPWAKNPARPESKSRKRILVIDDDPEIRKTIEFRNMFVICPDLEGWENGKLKKGRLVKDDFEYASDSNQEWLAPSDLRKLLARE